jgi:hypothetical protein
VEGADTDRARPPIGGQSRPVWEKPIVRNVESDASSSWILSCGPINRLPGDRWRHVAQTRECAKLYPVGALVHLAQPIGSGLAASRPWVLADDNAGDPGSAWIASISLSSFTHGEQPGMTGAPIRASAAPTGPALMNEVVNLVD